MTAHRPKLDPDPWVTSSFSTDSASCVAVLRGEKRVFIRRGTGASHGVISFPLDVWSEFLADAYSGAESGVFTDTNGVATIARFGKNDDIVVTSRTNHVMLMFSGVEWDAFTAGVAAQEFNLEFSFQ